MLTVSSSTVRPRRVRSQPSPRLETRVAAGRPLLVLADVLGISQVRAGRTIQQIGAFCRVAHRILMCFVTTMLYWTTSFFLSTLPSVYLRYSFLKILHHSSNTTAGSMQVECDSWMRYPASRIRTCTDKLGGSWERDKAHRRAKLYDDDGHGKEVGLRLLLLAIVVMAARAVPPTNEHTSNDKEKSHGAKILAALRRTTTWSSIACFQRVYT